MSLERRPGLQARAYVMKQQHLEDAPSPEEAGELYRLAERLKELAPWRWMDESEVFGVQNPETGALGFVSMMGMAGEHFALALYLGAEGLYGFFELEDGGALVSPDQVLDTPQLQVSFENRDVLDKRDRETIKALGLKYRGAHAWPMFRSYRAGFMPWYVTADEARFLVHAVAQTLEVAPRVRADPDLLNVEGDEDDERLLVRVSRSEGDALVWEDRVMSIPPPAAPSHEAALDAETASRLNRLPRRRLELEVDLFSLPAGFGEKGERPRRPYVLMTADAESGMILGVEMLEPTPSVEEMRAGIPSIIAALFERAGLVPETITTRTTALADLIGSLAFTLRIELRRADELPAIDEARDSMFGMMGFGES